MCIYTDGSTTPTIPNAFSTTCVGAFDSNMYISPHLTAVSSPLTTDFALSSSSYAAYNCGITTVGKIVPMASL